MEREPPSHRNVVVIGGSAGGIDALHRVLGGLPANLPASVLVVVHVASDAPSFLARVLGRWTNMPATNPLSDEPLHEGHVYVAAPGTHMIVVGDRVRAVDGPRENGHRPAIDPLFRSAARAHGRRVIGVVLSGSLDDGAHGLMLVKKSGGIAIVQTPDDARFPSMPRNALEAVEADYVLPSDDIAAAIVRLCAEKIARTPTVTEEEAATATKSIDENDPRAHREDVYTCPECGGVLHELHGEGRTRFQCRTGHAYSLQSLLAHQAVHLESALWGAVNVLKERTDLARRLAERAEGRGLTVAARRYRRQETESQRNADIIEQLLQAERVVLEGDPTAPPTSSEGDDRDA